MAQMPARCFLREHMSEQNALIDFDAVLVALQVLAFGGDLFGRRRQAGHRGGGGEHQIFQADEARTPLRQLIVERRRMRAQKALARRARGSENRVRRLGLGVAALRLFRQPRDQRVALLPELREADAVADQVRGIARHRGKPCGGCVCIKARFLQAALCCSVIHCSNLRPAADDALGVARRALDGSGSGPSYCVAFFSPSNLASSTSLSRCSWTAAPNSAGPWIATTWPVSSSFLLMSGLASATLRKSAAMRLRTSADIDAGANTPPALSNVRSG